MLYLKQYEKNSKLRQKLSRLSSSLDPQTSSSFSNETNLIVNTINFKKKKSCFLPMFDVVSTQCRLMCHEKKTHVKQWLMLVNSVLLRDFDIVILGKEENRLSLSPMKSAATSSFSVERNQQVPLLLRDPIAILLLTLLNLTLSTLDKEIFNHVISSCFNLVYVQAILDLYKEFDEEERANWSKNLNELVSFNLKNNSKKKFLISPALFKKSDSKIDDYIGYVINSLRKTNFIKSKTKSSFFMVILILFIEF
jgi:hypothetical protein